MKARLVSENIHFEKGRDPRASMGIGDKKAQFKKELQHFAEEMGWEFNITPLGVVTLTTPFSLDVYHNLESSKGDWRNYGRHGKFAADALRYKTSWLDDWAEYGTPLSLRKVYMRDGKEIKQNLMYRLPDIQEVIRRIRANYPKELKKAGIVSEAINFEKGKNPMDSLDIGRSKKRKADAFDKKHTTFWNKTFPGRRKATHGVISNIDRTDDPEEMVTDLMKLFPENYHLSGTGMNYRRREIYVGFEDHIGMEWEYVIKFNGDVYEDFGKKLFLGNMYEEPEKVREGIDNFSMVEEQVRFNFDEPPYKRYQSREGISGPKIPNPRKRAEGLTPEEEEIIDKHRAKLDKLQERIDELEDDIQEYRYEIEKLEDYGPDPGEVEQFDSEVIQRFGGWKALDILNSGIPNEDKVRELDKMDPRSDSGLSDYQEIVRDYDYYHPPEPDNEEEIQGFQDQIDIREKEISEIEARMEKLYTKIHNLETY
jgi:hypothetical protein